MTQHHNRQARRKAERAAARRPRVDLETGTVAEPLGHHFAPEAVAAIPPKVPGRHRWILSSGYTVTDSEAAEAHEGRRKVLMGPASLISFGIGCLDCEQIYAEAVVEPCPGDPSGVEVE